MHALATTVIAIATTIAPCTAHGQEVMLLQSSDGVSPRVTGMAVDAKLICGVVDTGGRSGWQAAIWDDQGHGVWTHLTTYGVQDRVCTGLSPNGRFAVGYNQYDPIKQCGGAMYWDRDTATPFCLPQTWSGKANAITSDGRTIAGSDMDQAILWIDGQRYVLGTSTFHSETTSLTSDGSAAVGYLASSYEVCDAFVWNRDYGLSILPTFGSGANASAMAISADGSVIVGYCGWLYNGWLVRWTRDSSTGEYVIERLGTDDQTTLFSFGYPAAAVSPDGSVIAGSLARPAPDGSYMSEAVLWTQRTGLTPVSGWLQDVPYGYALLDVRGVASDNRTLAGNGQFVDENGAYRDSLGWLATLPCPSDFNRSGFVDTEDFDSFVRAFEEGIPEADFDGSGFVDTEDYDAFVSAFQAGC